MRRDESNANKIDYIAHRMNAEIEKIKKGQLGQSRPRRTKKKIRAGERKDDCEAACLAGERGLISRLGSKGREFRVGRRPQIGPICPAKEGGGKKNRFQQRGRAEQRRVEERSAIVKEKKGRGKPGFQGISEMNLKQPPRLEREGK